VKVESASAFQSAIVQQGRFLPGLHGLRGAAALAVVLFHLVTVGRIAPPVSFDFIGRDFGYSVHLFFILSAFSLCISTEPNVGGAKWTQVYFIKRFFRIAPLFYFMILHELLRQYFGANRIISDINTILLHLTFSFGFIPFKSIVWAGWSVGVEMIFYAIFPVMLLIIRSFRSALFIFGVCLLISFASRVAFDAQHLANPDINRWNWAYFAFPSNIVFFAMGFIAYQASKLQNNKWVSVFAIALIVALLFFDVGQYLKGPARLDIVIWGIGLTALCIWQSQAPSQVFANPFLEWAGERSFSIFLLHPVIIFYSRDGLHSIYDAASVYVGAYAFFVCAIVLFAFVMICAEVTYKVIEVPGIRFGSRIIKQISTSKSAT